MIIVIPNSYFPIFNSQLYYYHTLANGIRIIFRPTQSIVTHVGVYIGVGSRNEQGSEEGIAHFIEHSIF